MTRIEAFQAIDRLVRAAKELETAELEFASAMNGVAEIIDEQFPLSKVTDTKEQP